MSSKTLNKEERNKLIVDNIPLVHSMISRYIYIGDDEIDDLFQIGCLYLTIAADKFNPDLGVKFSTYACNYILNGIKRYRTLIPNKYRGLHISRTDIDLIYKIAKYTKDSMHMTEQEKEVISKELNIDKKKIESLNISILSLDAKVESDDKEEISNVFDLEYIEQGYNNTITKIEIEEMLNLAKKTLKERDYNIIKYVIIQHTKYDCTPTKKDLAKKYGLCEPTIRRIFNNFKNIYKEERKDNNENNTNKHTRRI